VVDLRRVHVTGVAGVGMSAVAQAALGAGMAVSGSDRYNDGGESLPVLAQLRGAGVSLYPQDGSGVRAGTDAVVVSTAIEADNPDLAAAAAAGVPVLHRSALLARLAEGHCCLAVAGTCGKSTVTGMAGWILEQAGLDPTVVNGAPVTNWQSDARVGNVRTGRSDLWVIEADESDRSLLNYRPRHAVVTNMSADHFDLEETRRVFESFRARVSGLCIGALDGSAYLNGVIPEISAGGCRFVFRGVDFHLALRGVHNVENALHATMLCGLAGVDVEQSAAALRTFRGIHRRLEIVACTGGVTVIDDYAHNPAKIAAALAATVPFARRLTVVWRPHGYGPLRSMLDGLADAFGVLRGSSGHRLLLLPVYDAGGTADRRIGSEALAGRLDAAGVAVECVADYAAVRQVVRQTGMEAGDTVLVMGARDPGLPALARALADDSA
jgi:UDP-N-acetylmuramate--alanine ligase